MLADLNNKAVSTLMRGAIPESAGDPDSVQRAPEPERNAQRQRYNANRGDDALEEARRANQAAAQSASRNPQAQRPTAPVHVGPKIGRNDPCPCGSGKKYKNCHGRGLV